MELSTKIHHRDFDVTNEVGLLDTSVIVDLDSLSISVLPMTATISAVTLAELSVGPVAAKNDFTRAQRQLRLQATESQFSVLPFDSHAARMYAVLYQMLFASGVKTRGGRALDLMIAATALANHLPLYTRNPKDFVGLEQLIDIVVV